MKAEYSIVILGGGEMGSATAVLYAGNGMKVTLVSRNQAGCEKALKRAENILDSLAEESLITGVQKEKTLSKIAFTTSYEQLSCADFAVEAIAENPQVKAEFYQKIEPLLGKDTVLVSTTSGLMPDLLARPLKNKSRFLVGHSWNPPHLVPLVEVVRCQETSEQTVQKFISLCQAAGREPVVLRKAVPGFIGNRLMHAMYREALLLVKQGVASPEEIDKAVLASFGPRFSSVGLLENYDASGLDLQLQVEGYLFEDLCCDKAPPEFIQELVAQGKLGMKTGAGLYQWNRQKEQDFQLRRSRPFYNFFTMQQE